MGYIKHHAIVVTSWDSDMLATAHARALEIGGAITPVVASAVNGYATFLVAPDGSKEGWDDSDLGEARRDTFVKWLDRQRYVDGSTSLHWVEIAYGSDDASAVVVRHAWTDEHAER